MRQERLTSTIQLRADLAAARAEVERLKGDNALAAIIVEPLKADNARLRETLLRVRPCVACTMMARELLPIIDAALAKE